MWKLLYYLFKWDYVLTKFCNCWKVKKVTWFHNNAFCRPCMDREFISDTEFTDYGTIWTPLTPNMFRYKLKLQQKKEIKRCYK